MFSTVTDRKKGEICDSLCWNMGETSDSFFCNVTSSTYKVSEIKNKKVKKHGFFFFCYLI